MLKKNILLGSLALTAIGTAAAFSGALAYRGNASQTGPNYSPERHEQMEKAFENKDFGTWKSLMTGRGRVTEVVNSGNFTRFAEMHRLREEGKSEQADKIRKELGLGQQNGQGKGQGQRRDESERGKNLGGNFVDADRDGNCDRK